jgi:hypothetical protein
MLKLKLLGFVVNLFLIIMISARTSKDNAGLNSFATKSPLLGSPSSAQRSLNFFTGFAIFVYLAIAVRLNFLMN